MKRAPLEIVIAKGALSLSILRYSDGRFGFDHRPQGCARQKIRCKFLEDAIARAKEIVGAGDGGKVDRLSIDQEEYMEFLAWKSAKKKPAMIPALVSDLLAHRESKGCTVATVRELKSTLSGFAKAFTGPIGGLVRRDVEKWLDSHGNGPRRWNNRRAAIMALHHYARAHSLIQADRTPVEQIEKRQVVVDIETYTPEEFERLLAVVPAPWLPLLVLGGFCGLRPEEIKPDPRNGGWKPGLVWENILWSKGKIDLPARVSKVRRRRFPVLTDAAADFLAGWRDARGPVVPVQDYHKLTGAWSKAADVPWRPNALRHSYASFRLAIKKDAPALALEMGNSATMLFKHYLDLKHEDEAEKWFAIRPPSNIVSMTA